MEKPLSRRARALLDRQAWAAYEAFQRRKAAVEPTARRRNQLASQVSSTPEGSKTLFRDLSFHVRRGDRLVIRGPNGSGKTTLLNVITGSALPDCGSVRHRANVEPAFLAQDPGGIDSELSPLEICGSDTAARTLLACLKVRPDCLNRPLRDLSGGERTKVALARILDSRVNLLLLDEPTNHLEIEAQEALEQALRLYPGTLIVVSHDRVFLDALGPAVTYLDLTRSDSRAT